MPALALHLVASGAIGVTIKKFFTIDRVADGFCRRLYLYAPQIGDDLPDFFIGHANALTVGPVRRHDRAGNSEADVLEHFSIRVAVTLVGSSEIWTAATAMGAESVTKGAIDAEFVLASLGCLRVSRKWIAILGGIGRDGEDGRY